MDLRLEKETQVRVRLVDQPLEAVVLGAGKCIESYESVKAMFMTTSRRR
jgi:rod shape-determining protein MreB